MEKFEHWAGDEYTNDMNEFGRIRIPISSDIRAKLSSSDPVACAQFFQRLVETVLSTLFCSENDPSIKKSEPISVKQFGVFGRIIAHCIVFEVQGRGALHLHGLLWGSITPYVIQMVTTKNEELLELITEAIDSMVQAYLPIKAYKDQIIRKQNPGNYTRPGLGQFTYKPDAPEEFDERSSYVCSAVQVHKHSFTCHKGKSGKYSCRLGYPSNMQPHKTQALEIILQDNGSVRTNPDFEPFTKPAIMNYYPFDPQDTRTIVFSLKRPYHNEVPVSDPLYNRNGLVVPFNKACSAVLGCNTAMMLLGCVEQCKTAVFYTLDYMTKDAQALENSLSVIYNARKQLITNPSKASDAGTTERNTKHLLQRIVNNLCGQVETSAMMAAASLLGMPSTMCSHSFWYCYIIPAIRYVKTNLRTPEEEQVTNDLDLDDESEELFDLEATTNCTSDDGGSQVFEINGNYIPVHQHIHYAYRGIHLQILNFYEYCAIVRICKRVTKPLSTAEEVEEFEDETKVDMKSETDSTDGDSENEEGMELNEICEQNLTSSPDSLKKRKRSRPLNQVFEFDDGHPLQNVYYQKIRSKLLVPILAGKSPPYLPVPPDDFENNRTWICKSKQFAEYYITLMIPWDIQTKVPGIANGCTFSELLSYKTFCNWAHDLKNSSASFIEKCRLTSIEHIATSLRVDKVKKKNSQCMAGTISKAVG
jgi:hypothetical protein